MSCEERGSLDCAAFQELESFFDNLAENPARLVGQQQQQRPPLAEPQLDKEGDY